MAKTAIIGVNTAPSSTPRIILYRTNWVELTLPSGFGVDSFVPAPGWKRQVQQNGSGESTVVQSVI